MTNTGPASDPVTKWKGPQPTVDEALELADSGLPGSTHVISYPRALRALAAEVRRLSDPVETKPARDAEHCDFPDCEKHNALVVERLRGALQKIVARYDGFTSAKEMMQWARVALAACPPVETTDLPPHDTRVLVWYRDGRDWWISKRVSRNGKDAWVSAGGYCDINKVIAWRPLPTVPGEL